MTYDAVSAYTVLFGDGEAPTTVTVHGSAGEAWRALDALVRAHETPSRRRWRGRATAWAEAAGGPSSEVVSEAAEAWRRADPERRFWQVAPHRLQVTLPAIAAGRPPGA